MSTSVLISTFPPFSTLTFLVPTDTSFGTLYGLLADRYPELPAGLVLSPNRGPPPASDRTLSSLSPVEAAPSDRVPLMSLRLVPRLLGGKGGFGSQLRAAGGRMSSQKTSNNDSCRDLSGRRLSTIKEAKRLAEYIENEPARKKAQQEEKKAKLEALEKQLGIVPGGEGAGPSTSEPVAGKKHRFEDTDYLEQSRDIVDNVKSAVTVAMLKKRKKAKTSHSPSGAPAASATAAAASVSEKILESPATAPVVAAASAAAGLASA